MIGNIYPDNKWQTARLGCFTSSRCDDLLTEPRAKAAKDAGELSETAKSYIDEKASELVTGTIRDFSSASVEWGELYEPEAAEEVKKHYPGLIYYGGSNPKFFPLTKFSGGSPDGIDDYTVHEFKCPENPTNHIKYCRLKSADDLKKLERGYYHQIQMNMLCVAKFFGCKFTEMKAIFTSYCPIVIDGFKKLKMIEIYPEIGFENRLLDIIARAELRLAEIIEEMRDNPVMIASYDNQISATIVDQINLSKLQKI